jgi:inosose dehydratase
LVDHHLSKSQAAHTAPDRVGGRALGTGLCRSRIFDGSAIPVCLGTGHYFVRGGSPASLAGAVADRIAHVHLKDAEPGLAGRVRQGALGYAEGVRARMYVRLGEGAAEIAATVGALESAGYQGWYFDGGTCCFASTSPIAARRPHRRPGGGLPMLIDPI